MARNKHLFFCTFWAQRVSPARRIHLSPSSSRSDPSDTRSPESPAWPPGACRWLAGVGAGVGSFEDCKGVPGRPLGGCVGARARSFGGFVGAEVGSFGGCICAVSGSQEFSFLGRLPVWLADFPPFRFSGARWDMCLPKKADGWERGGRRRRGETEENKTRQMWKSERPLQK